MLHSTATLASEFEQGLFPPLKGLPRGLRETAGATRGRVVLGAAAVRHSPGREIPSPAVFVIAVAGRECTVVPFTPFRRRW